ncbi:MAG: hypothetical protein ACR2LN_07970 [Candidatus Levyibacteriota bacterium]
MRFSARLLFLIFSVILSVCAVASPVAAQTIAPANTSQSPAASYEQFRTPDVDANVPRNSHTYTQAVMIDVVSALMCQLTGVDPTNSQQSCVGVNPQTGKIGMVSNQQQLSQNDGSTPQIGGALGVMTNYVSELYTPVVSSSQYYNYLASNFGIIKPALAQAPPAAPTAKGTQPTDCSSDAFGGYGLCGLQPIFSLWKIIRGFSYVLLTLVFVVLGIGVMVRFKVDPRTVMTLQNQIPRVVISILLITFSYAIAGLMIDLMWTATYAGIARLSSAAPKSQIASCPPGAVSSAGNAITSVSNATGATVQEAKTPVASISGAPINTVSQQLINQPVSFSDTLFLSDCKGSGIHSGILHISELVSKAFGGLVTDVVKNILGLNVDPGCHFYSLGSCPAAFILWIAQQIVKLIIVIALFIALFRLWFELLKTYITILIFVIMGPLWIIFGLIPGRPLGFEKWLRIMFANLAAFPLVAFILVFGRVMMDTVPATNAGPQSIFIPPLIGNPNVQNFGIFIGFGAIMLAPTIPGMIKERMKAKGSGDYGKTISAGLGFAAGAATAPGKGVWESLNHKNPTTGAPEGSLAVMKQRMWQKTPLVGRRSIAKHSALEKARTEHGGSLVNYRQDKKAARQTLKGDSLEKKVTDPTRLNRFTNTFVGGRRERRLNDLRPPTPPPTTPTPPVTPPAGNGGDTSGSGTNNGDGNP